MLDGGGAIAGAILTVLGVLLGAVTMAVAGGSRFVVLVVSLVSGAASIGAGFLAAGGRVWLVMRTAVALSLAAASARSSSRSHRGGTPHPGARCTHRAKFHRLAIGCYVPNAVVCWTPSVVEAEYASSVDLPFTSNEKSPWTFMITGWSVVVDTGIDEAGASCNPEDVT